jgi:hypothetical protein
MRRLNGRIALIGRTAATRVLGARWPLGASGCHHGLFLTAPLVAQETSDRSRVRADEGRALVSRVVESYSRRRAGCLSEGGRLAQAAAVSSEYAVNSEVGRLRKVLVCAPGLAHGRLTPSNCGGLTTTGRRDQRCELVSRHLRHMIDPLYR